MKLSKTQLRSLKALERKAHKWAEDACNYGVSDRTYTRRQNIITAEVKDILGDIPQGFFINGDPRGYALKLDPEQGADTSGFETDWGRFGILSRPL